LKVSNTSLSTFRDCPYKYYLTSILRIEPLTKSWPLIDGSIFHKAIENYYRLTDANPDQPIAMTDLLNNCIIWRKKKIEDLTTNELVALDTVEREYAKADLPYSDYHKHLVMGMVAGYTLLYPSNEFEEMKPEYATSVILEDYELRIRVDNLVKDAHGHWWVYEYKTTSEDSKERFLDRMLMDWQPYLYTYVLKRLGIDCVGVIYPVMKKPKFYKGLLESDGGFNKRLCKSLIDDALKEQKYFYREPIFKSPDDMVDFEVSLMAMLKDLKFHTLEFLWVQNRNRCFDRREPCEFMAICKESNPYLREECIKTQFKKRI